MRWHAFGRAIALAVWLGVAWPVAAAPLPLPEPIPAGSSAEVVQGIQWLYPTRASSEVQALMQRAPEAWRELSESLGAPQAPTDVQVRVALDPRGMQALAPPGVRLPDYASGVALPERGLILLTLSEPGTWQRPDMEGVLVHELSHVALHRAVAGRPVPRWFTEGVAIHESGERSLERVRTLWEGALGRRLYPLGELSRAFPAQHHRVNLAYAQAADMVRFLLDAGPQRFTRLIEQLRQGTDFERAVEVAYDRSLESLERDWHQGLDARFASWPLVLGSLTGLWALGAVLLVIGYVRTRRKHHQTLKRWAIEEAPLIELPVASEAGPARSPADEVLDALERGRKSEPSVPTVEHEGQSHTLH
jgi:hypothetical protein